MTLRLSIARALLLAGLVAAIPSRSEADSGGIFNLPQGGMKPKHGLQLVIDTRWVEGNGYLPVRVTAHNWPPGPTVADRSIRIVLQPSSWQWGRGTVRVTGYVEIPEGATRGQTTVAVPHSDAWASMEVRVYENGRSLDDLSSWIGAGPGNYGGDSESIPTVLIVDADAPLRDDRDQFVLQRGSKPGTSATAVPPRRLPDIRHLVSLFPEPNRGGMSGGSRLQSPGGDPVDDAATLLALRDTPRVELLRPSELPTRWIDFTSFDLVFVSFADLQDLAVNQPAAWQALRDWAASGPTLCVYDMALSDEQLAKLDALLGLPDRTDATGVMDTAAPSNPWKAPDSKHATEEIMALEVVRRSQYSAANDVTPAPQIAGTKASSPPDSPPFVCRAFYRGRVVAIQADEPLAAGQYGAAWLLNELDSKSWMWYQRHGMSLFRENDDYWNWIVPGIGRAPVGTFLLLITAFVIVIGPVNYFFLRRRRRLYWLLVTVPVGAGAVTLVLFTYALISDGLGVRVRVRSFSEIDQQAGQAVSWSRQSYYAGLAPSGGLRFPDRAAVFPLEQYPAERRGGRLGTYELVWSEGQNLVSGYLGPGRRRSSWLWSPDRAGVVCGSLRIREAAIRR